MKWKILILQFDVVFGDPWENKAKIEDKIRGVTMDEVDVLVLPELWSSGYDLSRLPEICAESQSAMLAFLKNLALEHDVMVVGGSLADHHNGSYYNTMPVIDRRGEQVKAYSKLHLFRLMNEDKYLSEGTGDGFFTLEDIPCSGLICYDIRFPEWVRHHALKHAEVFFVVAEWPHARIDHWTALLTSRAIENQCFIVACNRVGADPDNVFGGTSMVIDPWGEVLLKASEDREEILMIDIDLEESKSVRNRIPVFEDRRPAFYKLN